MSHALTLARPYARAAFGLAKEHGRLAPWSNLLGFAASIAADARVQNLLGHPKLSLDDVLGLLLPPGDIDPNFRTYDQASWHFGEDMLQIENRMLGVLIDLGWFPAHRAKGSYRLVATRFFKDPEHGWTGDSDRPLRRLRTRSQRKVVATIEGWLHWYGDHPPRPRRAKK